MFQRWLDYPLDTHAGTKSPMKKSSLQCSGQESSLPAMTTSITTHHFIPGGLSSCLSEATTSRSVFQQCSGPSPAPEPACTARQAQRRGSTMSHLGERKDKGKRLEEPRYKPQNSQPTRISSAEITLSENKSSTALTASHHYLL